MQKENILAYILTFIIAMVPFIELRGAIPFAQLQGVPLLYAYPLAIIGNMLPVPFIFLFARKILLWGKDLPFVGAFFQWVLGKGEHAGQKLQQKAGEKGLFVALLLFVAIPFPGTGAWSGTLGASLLDLDFKLCVRAVLCGVLLAGILMSVLAGGLSFLF